MKLLTPLLVLLLVAGHASDAPAKEHHRKDHPNKESPKASSTGALAFKPIQPGDPTDDGGLYAEGNKAATARSGAGVHQFTPETLNSPYIRGGLIRLSWNTLEPTEGSYNWAPLDAIVKELKQRKLKYKLSVSAGADTPNWVLDSPKAQSFRNQRGRRHEVKSPIPWDPVYLEHWAKFIRALGKHIGSDPDFVSIRLGGVQAGTSIEMGIPKELLNQGYTPQKIKQAWADDMRVYAEAFPGKPFVINLNPLITTPEESGEQTTRAIVDQAAARYGRRFVLSSSGINPVSIDKGFTPDLIKTYTASDRLWAQLGTWAPVTGKSEAMGRSKDDPVEKKLRDTFDGAFRLRAKYLTIDQKDLNDPRLQDGLRYVGAKQEAEEGRLLRFTVSAAEDRPDFKYSARNLPPGASFDSASRTFTWTPGPSQAGTFLVVQFEVSGGGQSGSQEVPIIVRKKAG